MEYWYLDNNHLSDTIPSELGKLSKMLYLQLQNNYLSGTIPCELGKLSKMVYLRLQNNHLRGALPQELGDATSLTKLYVTHNTLQGTIPETLGKLVDLQELYLANNKFSGNIPRNFGELVKLSALLLANNLLTGPLPRELGNATSLKTLDASSNSLSSSIPLQVWKMNLKTLRLNRNAISGTIPIIMPSLQQLMLGSNSLQGRLPETLINHTRLVMLHLSGNKLIGTLPNYSFPNTRYLYLHGNFFDGSMQFAAAVPREHVTLHDNDFSGHVPHMRFVLSASQAVLTLHGNHLCCQLPGNMSFGSEREVFNGRDFYGQATFWLTTSNKSDGWLSGVYTRASGCREQIKAQRLDEAGTHVYKIEQSDKQNHGCRRRHLQANITWDKGAQMWISNDWMKLEFEKISAFGSNSTRLKKASIVLGNYFEQSEEEEPGWMPEAETDTVLFRHSSVVNSVYTALGGATAFFLVVLFTVKGLSLSHLKMLATDRNDFVISCHKHLFKIILGCSIPGFLGLLPTYLSSTGYFECADLELQSSAASLNVMMGSSMIFQPSQVWIALVLLAHLCICGAMLRKLPRPDHAASQSSAKPPDGFLWKLTKKIMAWIGFLCIITLCAAPSIVYSVTNTLPKNNAVRNFVGGAMYTSLHFLAPLLATVANSILLPPIAELYEKRVGLRLSILLMVGRLASTWLIAAIMIIILDVNCAGRWRYFWGECSALRHSAGYLGYLDIAWPFPWLQGAALTTNEMCTMADASRWLGQGRCARAVIAGMGPFLLKKLVIVATLVPCAELVKMQITQLWNNFLYVYINEAHPNHVLSLPSPKPVDASVAASKHISQLTTWAELAIIWGPLVPILYIPLGLAVATNLCLYTIATHRFCIYGTHVPGHSAGKYISEKFLWLSFGFSWAMMTWFTHDLRMLCQWPLYFCPFVGVIGICRRTAGQKTEPSAAHDEGELELSYEASFGYSLNDNAQNRSS